MSYQRKYNDGNALHIVSATTCPSQLISAKGTQAHHELLRNALPLRRSKCLSRIQFHHLVSYNVHGTTTAPLDRL